MKQFIGLLALAMAISGLAQADYSDLHKGRGNPWEYDQGPAKDSEILRVLNELPNYRTIGRTVMGEVRGRIQERFRWHWGPAFYRGRLGKNQVKVLIIGQEGGQDEALVKRAFTGGTGQSMQGFLNYIGIKRSYLFLNTFIYSIRGQYRDKGKRDDGTLKLPNAYKGDYWMAQSLQSPIVQHRHKLFNQVLKQNPILRLVIAVGGGAKDTVQTWVKSRGGKCKTKGKVESCDSSVLGANIQLLGVKHPGMLGQAKTDEQRKKFRRVLEIDFQKAADAVAKKVYYEPQWLTADPDGKLPEVTSTSENGRRRIGFKQPYRYKNDPVPYRDFSFGHLWMMGRRSTRSNRSTDQRSITSYSTGGKYADGSVRFPNGGRVRKTGKVGSDYQTSGYIYVEGDVPYEPSRVTPNAYDRGPGKTWAKLLMGGEKGLEWPDFSKLGTVSHRSFGHGPIYRGRLDSPRILVIADQQSHDDMFTGRALSGDGGQKIQHFLTKLGVYHHYAIIRTLPVDTLGLSFKKVQEISQNPQVVKVRSAILRRLIDKPKVRPDIILTFGPHAQKALKGVLLPKDAMIVSSLKAPLEKGAVDSWNKAFDDLADDLETLGYKPNRTFKYEQKPFKNVRLQINRHDLPFSTIRWFGTSGSLASRSTNRGGNYYQMSMPLWAARWKATELNERERRALIRGGWLGF